MSIERWYWPVMFVLLALVCAVFGFSGILMGASGLAVALFYVFLGVAIGCAVPLRELP